MSEGTKSGLPAWIAMAVLIGVAYALVPLLQGPTPPPEHVPQPLPPIWAEGWLGPEGPVDEASLQGKLVAVDFWSMKCGPCLAEMPKMAQLRDRLRDQEDFVLIGVVRESMIGYPEDLESLEEYVASVEGFDWPVAYGAEPFYSALDISVLPTLILFGRDGQSVWRGWHAEGLAAAIDAELAKSAGG